MPLSTTKPAKTISLQIKSGAVSAEQGQKVTNITEAASVGDKYVSNATDVNKGLLNQNQLYEIETWYLRDDGLEPNLENGSITFANNFSSTTYVDGFGLTDLVITAIGTALVNSVLTPLASKIGTFVGESVNNAIAASASKKFAKFTGSDLISGLTNYLQSLTAEHNRELAENYTLEGDSLIYFNETTFISAKEQFPPDFTSSSRKGVTKTAMVIGENRTIGMFRGGPIGESEPHYNEGMQPLYGPLDLNSFGAIQTIDALGDGDYIPSGMIVFYRITTVMKK